MIITIGSGKGGTGKTTLATSLAMALDQAELPVQLLDCDVEEPNAGILLKPNLNNSEAVLVDSPVIDNEKCTYGGRCAEFCHFKALAIIPGKPLVFPEMCHSCGGCIRVCPEGAITYKKREIGSIELGNSEGISFGQGTMNIGEARATPVISKLIESIDPNQTTILDAPPGTSCPFVETVKKSDICVLVTEPTPFGLNDLSLAVEALKRLSIPCCVVINRCDVGDDRVEKYCEENEIAVPLMIPHDLEIAKAYSRGEPLIQARPEYADILLNFYQKLQKLSGAVT